MQDRVRVLGAFLKGSDMRRPPLCTTVIIAVSHGKSFMLHHAAAAQAPAQLLTGA
jgi:hypothetical protein